MGTEDIVVAITIDGRDIPLNRFVQKFVSSVVAGMIDSLRGVDGWEGATVTVKRKSGRNC
ncbi:hypothetical protein KEJ39_00225 [Candidatus Bathyarchaeota archaeon]|nr:hypothetical protein [Candidatus Bathyarchaeota archaeon]